CPKRRKKTEVRMRTTAMVLGREMVILGIGSAFYASVSFCVSRMGNAEERRIWPIESSRAARHSTHIVQANPAPGLERRWVFAARCEWKVFPGACLYCRPR